MSDSTPVADSTTQPASSVPTPIAMDTVVSDPVPRVSAEPVAGNEQPVVPTVPAGGPNPVELGAPARQWINQNITPALLEGMRHVTKERLV